MLENWDDDDDDDDNCNIMTTMEKLTIKPENDNVLTGVFDVKNDEKHKILLATTVAQPEKLTDAKI